MMIILCQWDFNDQTENDCKGPQTLYRASYTLKGPYTLKGTKHPKEPRTH